MTRKQAIYGLFFSCIGFATGDLIVKRIQTLCGSNIDPFGSYRELIAEIAEMIIPHSADSPGAKECNVSDYIISIMNNCSSPRERMVFIAGLDDVENYCRGELSKSFINCRFSERMRVLEYFENRGAFSNPLIDRVRLKILGPTFFEIIKKQTVYGYFTSENGANSYVPTKMLGVKIFI